MTIQESDLQFTFDEVYNVIKFDDCKFYRNSFNQLPSAKGVDIIADSKDMVQLIEIKNCLNYERENLWRTSVNNGKLDKAPRDLNVENRDSFDIEVSKKVAFTLLCLYGAWTKQESDNAQELLGYWKGITDEKIAKQKKPIYIIFFLEGNFGTTGIKSRKKKTIMQRLQESIKKKLQWLNCKVMVVDSDTYNERYFEISSDKMGG